MSRIVTGCGGDTDFNGGLLYRAPSVYDKEKLANWPPLIRFHLFTVTEVAAGYECLRFESNSRYVERVQMGGGVDWRNRIYGSIPCTASPPQISTGVTTVSYPSSLTHPLIRFQHPYTRWGFSAGLVSETYGC